MRLRRLGPGDEAPLEAFLAGHRASSMFLRSNLRAGGLEDHGDPYQATWAAAFEGDRPVGVAAHCWNGMLVLQAPRAVAEVARLAVADERPVLGLAGPWAQVQAARSALGLAERPARLESREELFGLTLDQLRVPAPLADGSLVCRAPRDPELAGLTRWRVAFLVEALKEAPGRTLEAIAAAEMKRLQAEGRHWVATRDDLPVAYAAFNAVLADSVQVGGVYTPPAERGRGHARAAVAGSLRAARAAGASEAYLFTGADNQPAIRAYLSLGFRVVGDYGLVSFV